MRKILVCFLSIMFAFDAYASDVYQKSVKKDGKYHNYATEPDTDFFDFASMYMTTDWKPWPEHVSVSSVTNELPRVDSNDMRVVFINHATFLVQTRGINILTDPVFSDRCSPVGFAGPKRVHEPGIDIEKLPTIDLVIISHDHYDHLDTESLDFLIERDNPIIFVGEGVSKRLSDNAKVVELNWWDEFKYNEDLSVNFVPGQHFSGRSLTDSYSTLWGGYMLDFKNSKIFFAGDTGYADHFKQISSKYGDVDFSFIPIGAYLPRDFMKFFHMDPNEAVMAHNDIKSKYTLAMHYGTFRLAAEGINDPTETLDKLKKSGKVKYGEFEYIPVGVVQNYVWDKSKQEYIHVL